MKGIYLASYKAYHKNYDIIYQDINGKRDLSGDMMNIDLKDYDYIIATPPCNYWSRANYRRDTSDYSLKTKHLLPDILIKLCKQDKPFIVENVRNDTLFLKNGLYDLPLFIYKIGRHTYFTNIILPLTNIKQDKENIQYLARNKRQGDKNVNVVIECFLELIHNKK